MHPIADEWYGRADNYQPKPGAKYGWVWDYAKFRFEWACEKSRYIDEKSITVLKLLLALCSGIGAVLAFLISNRIQLQWPTYAFSLIAIVCLCLSGRRALRAFRPENHLYPINEEAALEYTDRNEVDADPMGNISLTLSASTEFERETTERKSRCLQRAIVYASWSIVLFILALFVELVLKTAQSSHGHPGGL